MVATVMTAPHALARLIVLVLVAPSGCNSEAVSSTNGGEQGGTGTGTTSTTSTSTTEEPGDSGTESGSGSSGEETLGESSSTGSLECVPPADDALSGATTTITIRNDAAEPRFVVAAGDCGKDTLEVLVDGELVVHDHDGVVVTVCAQCQNQCGNGSTPGLIINPGQTADVDWNGGFWTPTERSQACALEACEDEPNPPTSCQVLQAMDEGINYTARVHVLDTCPFGDAEACGCDEDVCAYNVKSPTTDDMVEATAVFPTGASIVLE